MSQQTKPNKLHVILQICRYISRDYNINIFDKMTESHCTFCYYYGVYGTVYYAMLYMRMLHSCTIALFATKRTI